MQELEKILEEMKRIKDGNRKEKLYAKYPPNSKEQEVLNAYSHGYEDGTDNFYNAAEDIIRKHMNDGWIPVEERLPEDIDKEYYSMNIVTLENGSVCLGVYRNYEGEWWTRMTEEEVNYTNTRKVIAWMPLPEPYKMETQDKPEEHFPEWRTKFLGKFDKRV